MYARVVRFTDVDPDHLAGRLAEGEQGGQPPVDIPVRASSSSTTKTSAPLS